MMTYDAANEWLRKRLNLPTDKSSAQIAADIPEQVRTHSFFSARVAEARVLDRLRQVSDAYSRGELNMAEARTRLKEQLIGEEGYKPGGGLKNLASTARIELILEQNARMAAAVGQYQAGRDPDIEERFPCWRYLGSTALVPREDHARLIGKVFLKSDPIWRRIFPPSKFGCKCSVEDCDDTPDKPPRDLEPAEGGYSFNPADAFNFSMEKIDDPGIRGIVGEQLEFRFPEEAAAAKAPAVPAGIPVSDALELKIEDRALRNNVRHAIDVINSVHGDGELMSTPISGRAPSGGAKGEFHRWILGDKVTRTQINILRLGDTHGMTSTHEIGHLIDAFGLGRGDVTGAELRNSKELQGWFEAVKSSKTYQALSKVQGSHANYLRGPSELWARSYAQYIARKSRDPALLAELDRMVNCSYNNSYHAQWDEDDFEPIMGKIDALFRAKGWIR